jgi:hypothetical protein
MNINNDKRKWLFGGTFIGDNNAECFINSGIKFLERLTKTIE